MAFKFMQYLKNVLTEQQFKETLKVATDDIKFNRIGFGKTTNQVTFTNICTRCAVAVIKAGV